MKTIIFIVLAAMAICSCRRQQQAASEQALTTIIPAEQAAEAQFATLSCRNPENPADSVGAWHNRLLDSLQAYAESRNDFSWQGSLHHLAGLASRNFNIDAAPWLEPSVRNALRDTASLFSAAVASYPLSPSAKAYAVELFSVIKSTTDAGALNSYHSRICELERRIRAEAKMDPREQGYLLQASAIARYSGHYWANAKKPPRKRRGLLGWIVAVCSDTHAFIENVVGGDKDIIESVTGAVGTSNYWADTVPYGL